jgi:hypothetical protein
VYITQEIRLCIVCRETVVEGYIDGMRWRPVSLCLVQRWALLVNVLGWNG